MFVFTYMFAFKVRREIRWGVFLGYITAITWIYLPSQFGGYGRDITRLFMLEPLWIPIILYLLAIVFSAITFVYVRLRQSKPEG
jgi:uncharacterized membrane protein YhdT